MRAKYVVIDAVDALLHLYDSPIRERHELYTPARVAAWTGA